MTAAEGGACSVCGSPVFEPDCPACVVVHLAEAAARGLPGPAVGSVPGPDLSAAGGGPGSPAGAVLAAYGRLVEELVAQVADWQRSGERYAAALAGALQELRGVLGDLAGAAADEDGAA